MPAKYNYIVLTAIADDTKTYNIKNGNNNHKKMITIAIEI